MADIVYQINRTVDISKGTLITMLGLCNTKDQLVQGQSYAHQINVTVENNGEPVQLTGKCTANFVRQSDGSTVTVAGSVLGNVATVPFPSFVYAMVGALDITVFIGGAAILQIQTTVRLSGTMVIVDPGNILPNVEEIQQIMLNVEEALDQLTTALSNVQDATTSANAAAQKIDGLTITANTLSTGTPATASVALVNGAYQITIGVPQGVQGERGTTAYQGVAITGTSTTPTAYPTGIEAAIPGDLYYYNGTVPEQIGNVYMCSAGGDAETALWTFMANWRGATGAGSVSEVDGVSPGADGNVALNAVQYASQSLTTEQQQQAMNNIGAMSVSAFPYIIGAPLWGDGGADLSAAFSSADALYDAVSSNNFRYIRNGDYWPLELNGSFYDFAAGETKQLTSAIFKLQANVNTFLMYGSGSVASLPNPHILFVSADAFPMTLQYRPDSSSWYNQAATNPWLGSALYETLNNEENGILSILLETSIGPYIYAGTSGSGIPALLETKGKGVTSATGNSWQPRGRLFLPTEHEIAGGPTWASVNFGQGVPIQWPIFNASSKNMIKGLGNGASSTPWWTQSSREGGSTTFVYVGAGAIRGDANADVTICSVPLCFVFGGD